MTPPTQVTIAAGTLDVHEAGPPDGAPVLLLHGFPQHADSWLPVGSVLTGAGYRTIAPDQRGYSPGARPQSRASYRIDALVADAVAVIEARGGGRVHLVGHDWGAAVAWRLAARRPDLVRTLTAVSVPPLAAYVRAVLTSRQALASWYFAAFQLPWLPERRLRAGPEGYSRAFAATLRATGQSRDRARRDAEAMADPAALTAALNWYRAVSTGGSPGADPLVEVPTLFVWSDGDTAVLRPCTELVHRHVSGPFRYAELAGVSHWIPEEAPAELAELLLAQFAAHPG